MSSTSSSVRQAVGKPSRSHFGTVTPYLMVESITPFVDFLEKAFGAQELLREQGSGGGWHCEVQIGLGDVGNRIMIGGDHTEGELTLSWPVPRLRPRLTARSFSPACNSSLGLGSLTGLARCPDASVSDVPIVVKFNNMSVS
eukprot:scaffold1872_cov262-Amphora_coffeaeformis.AAC.14